MGWFVTHTHTHTHGRLLRIAHLELFVFTFLSLSLFLLFSSERMDARTEGKRGVVCTITCLLCWEEEERCNKASEGRVRTGQGQEQASLGGALSGVFNCIFWAGLGL